MKTLVATAGLAGLSAVSMAQIPGDGIPDIYYFPIDVTLQVSTGIINRPAGTVILDTDGTDVVAILIGSSTDFVTTPGSPGPPIVTGCDLCNGGSLPDPNAPPFFASSWTTGYINGSNQWVRTSPLDSDGFVGVIGEYEDPFGIFPDYGLAFAEPGTTFDPVFDDGTGTNWEVTIATANSGTIFTNVSGYLTYNNPPVAFDDEYTVSVGQTLDTALEGLPGLLDNDFDYEADFLVAEGPGGLLGGTLPTHGTVTVAPDGSFVYEHDGSPSTSDTFSYFAVDDLNANFDEGMVTITIVPEPALLTVIVLMMFMCIGSHARQTRRVKT